MSDLLIKNVTMPDCCFRCPFKNHDGMWVRCIFTGQNVEPETRRKTKASSCPLIEVEKFIELLFKLTDEGYALTISPGIEQNSILFTMDNCFKAPDRSEAWKCNYRTNKELLNYEEFEWIVIDLMLQLKKYSITKNLSGLL